MAEAIRIKRAALEADGLTAALTAGDYAGRVLVYADVTLTGGTTPTAVLTLKKSDTSGGTYADVQVMATGTTYLMDSRDLGGFLKLGVATTGTPTGIDINLIVAGWTK